MQAILAKRPFQSWPEVARLEGFDQQLVEKLVHGGVQLRRVA